MPPRIKPLPLEGMPDPAAQTGVSTIARLMANAPTAFAGYKPFTQAIFAKLQLDELDRELAVLLTAHLQGGSYQWSQHVHMVDAMGMPKGKVEAIARGELDSTLFDARERALLGYVREIVENVRVTDEVFEAAARHYSPRELVEIIFTVGHYMLLARISEVAQIPDDPPTGLKSLRAAEARAQTELQNGN